MKEVASCSCALLTLCFQLVSAQFSRLCTDGTPAIFPCDQAALVCRPDPRLICEFYDGTAYCCADPNDPRLQTTPSTPSTTTVASTTTRPTSTSTAVASTKLPTTRIIRTTRKVPTPPPVHGGCVDTMPECRSLSRLCKDSVRLRQTTKHIVNKNL
ncbi:hypothetical protein AAVH_29801 [Aphelenchoides avenae]|nr:hypothetical protein AAVH_29801 [Aphelenchus avenae]